MKNRLMDLLIPLLPKNELSHLVGKAVHRRVPGPVGRALVEGFARYYGINMSEAEHALENYQSIGELFTRKLKTGVRPIGEGIVHPCDGVITAAGEIKADTILQAKGKSYSVSEFLRNTHLASELNGGHYITYYLCPTDYHRVHSPIDAKVTWSAHVPGTLWPVNEWSVNRIAHLFVQNERIALSLEASQGKAALVMVAATNVGNMTISFDEHICTNQRVKERACRARTYDPAPELKRGDEVGIFHMGSTVVMLYQKNLLPFDAENLMGRRVRLGETLTGPT